MLSEKRKLLQGTAPIEQYPKTTVVNGASHSFLPLVPVRVGHHQLTEVRSATGQTVTLVLWPEMCKMPLGVIQYRYSSEDTAGKLRVELECFC